MNNMSILIKTVYFLIFTLLIIACNFKDENRTKLFQRLNGEKYLLGSQENLNTPFVAAGDRVYMVSHQDGTFPDLGWHISGEMGGIWNHPIKLMDGFVLQIISNELEQLTTAKSFKNYPFGNSHTYETQSLQIERFQFVPDGLQGLIVTFRIKNLTDKKISFGFEINGMVDLNPVWLAERKGIIDGTDSSFLHPTNHWIVSKDTKNEWFVIQSLEEGMDDHDLNKIFPSVQNKGKGHVTSMVKNVSIMPKSEIELTYKVSGSYLSFEHAKSEHLRLNESTKLLAAKIDRMSKIESFSRLTTGDDAFDEMFTWTKYATDWLIRDVPEIGRGLSAGIPDYPWWFGADNAYSLQGLLSTGQFEEVRSTIDLVMNISRSVNGNGRIMHETSTNGEVYNQGNLNETPHFIYLIWQAYSWIGDRELINKYYDDIKLGLLWIENQDKDGNGYPDGHGMMEIQGLDSEMIDVVVYLQAAYEAVSRMAILMNDSSYAMECSKKAETLKEKINKDWWVSDFNSFADFRADKKQTIDLIQAAIVRADTINKPLAIVELNGTLNQIQKSENQIAGRVVHHNWVVNTPMEIGIADKDKAKKGLETARNYRNRFGLYVTGMDKSEVASKWKAFSYVGAVMTLPTGVQAIAEARYGNPDESLAYLKNLQNSFSYTLPGSMYEVSPDYGMIAQAWNIYALAIPIVNCFFGINPRAYDQAIDIEMSLPTNWQNVKLENVRIGDNLISIENNQGLIKINQANGNWLINLKIKSKDDPRISGKDFVLVDSKSLSEGEKLIRISGTDILVERN